MNRDVLTAMAVVAAFCAFLFVMDVYVSPWLCRVLDGADGKPVTPPGLWCCPEPRN